MNYSTATADEIKAHRDNWVTFGQMMVFWKVQGMSISQDKMPTLEKTRVTSHNKTIIIVHHRNYSSEAYTIKDLVIYEGTSYYKKAPIFQTRDRSSAMTKLQEFF